jgi:hypothetical protein
MTRFGFYAAVAVGALAMAATALAAPPFAPTSAQARAEKACANEDVRPNSSAWELCLSHVTRAYEWSEPALARQLARAARDARQSCLEYGMAPETSGYRACVSREIDARANLQILGDDDSGANVAEAK